MDFESLSPELQQKARACKTPEELIELAQAEGVELDNEQLQAVSGGSWDENNGTCRKDMDDCSTFCPTAWHA